jgi:DNA helicase-2/ATP-dependent DNA helicase PcrA
MKISKIALENIEETNKFYLEFVSFKYTTKTIPLDDLSLYNNIFSPPEYFHSIKIEEKLYSYNVSNSSFNKNINELIKIQNNPYFGRIIFKTNEGVDDVYIGITHVVDDNNKYYVHDWRSPICNLFYDYEIGKANYIAPMGRINGDITLKRQYTIKDGKLFNIEY